MDATTEWDTSRNGTDNESTEPHIRIAMIQLETLFYWTTCGCLAGLGIKVTA